MNTMIVTESEDIEKSDETESDTKFADMGSYYIDINNDMSV